MKDSDDAVDVVKPMDIVRGSLNKKDMTKEYNSSLLASMAKEVQNGLKSTECETFAATLLKKKRLALIWKLMYELLKEMQKNVPSIVYAQALGNARCFFVDIEVALSEFARSEVPELGSVSRDLRYQCVMNLGDLWRYEAQLPKQLTDLNATERTEVNTESRKEDKKYQVNDHASYAFDHKTMSHAIEYYQSATHLNPTWGHAYNQLSVCYLQKKRYVDALLYSLLSMSAARPFILFGSENAQRNMNAIRKATGWSVRDEGSENDKVVTEEQKIKKMESSICHLFATICVKEEVDQVLMDRATTLWKRTMDESFDSQAEDQPFTISPSLAACLLCIQSLRSEKSEVQSTPSKNTKDFTMDKLLSIFLRGILDALSNALCLFPKDTQKSLDGDPTSPSHIKNISTTPNLCRSLFQAFLLLAPLLIGETKTKRTSGIFTPTFRTLAQHHFNVCCEKRYDLWHSRICSGKPVTGFTFKEAQSTLTRSSFTSFKTFCAQQTRKDILLHELPRLFYLPFELGFALDANEIGCKNKSIQGMEDRLRVYSLKSPHFQGLKEVDHVFQMYWRFLWCYREELGLHYRKRWDENEMSVRQKELRISKMQDEPYEVRKQISASSREEVKIVQKKKSVVTNISKSRSKSTFAQKIPEAISSPTLLETPEISQTTEALSQDWLSNALASPKASEMLSDGVHNTRSEFQLTQLVRSFSRVFEEEDKGEEEFEKEKLGTKSENSEKETEIEEREESGADSDSFSAEIEKDLDDIVGEVMFPAECNFMEVIKKDFEPLKRTTENEVQTSSPLNSDFFDSGGQKETTNEWVQPHESNATCKWDFHEPSHSGILKTKQESSVILMTDVGKTKKEGRNAENSISTQIGTDSDMKMERGWKPTTLDSLRQCTSVKDANSGEYSMDGVGSSPGVQFSMLAPLLHVEKKKL